MFFKKLCGLLLLLYCGYALANIQVYAFDDPVQEERFNLLVQELRCPKCQNNNLADSNSELSTDLKTIVYEKIIAGESNQQIIEYLIARYGDFITYRPPVKPSTWFIWFGPFVVLLLGLFLIYRFLAKRKSASQFVQETKQSQQSKLLVDEWTAEVVSQSSDKNEELN